MSDSTITPRTVKVGDGEVTITRFRGLKGLAATDIIDRVSTRWPSIQTELAAFIEDHRQQNGLKLTFGMSKTGGWRELGLTAEDFQPDGFILIPRDPDNRAIAFALLPSVLKLAREELFRLIALIAIPNSELEKADDEDNIPGALDKYSKKLLREGDLDELLEIADVGIQVLQDQITSKMNQGRLGKLTSLPFIRNLLNTATASDTDSTKSSTTPDPSSGLTPVEEASSNEPPTSSTDSPEDTDGTDAQSSTGPPGENSVSSDES
jgi:hypothetical protein